jgi:hypothetical protein
MSTKNVAVFGIYATVGTAESAVDHLLSVGFPNSYISVLLPDDESTRAFAHEKNTKAPEGTTTGVVTGGVVGGTIGLLAGIGALAIPGIGPLIAAGPIVAALAGMGAGGTVGGVVGALVGMGIPEYEAKRFEGAVKDGGVLLSVHCDSNEQVTAAKQALKDTGARDIASAHEEGSGKTTDRVVIANPEAVRPLTAMPVTSTTELPSRRSSLMNDSLVEDEVTVPETTTTRY